MTQLDVLPSALTASAVATRSFARSAQPASLHAEALSAALAFFTSRWTQAVRDLADDAERAADGLEESAQTYVQVESVLVPRALR